MRCLFNRALLVVAGVVASVATALPSLALESSAAANMGGITAPAARLADYTFRLDLPALLPGLSSGPQDLSRTATNEVESDFVLFDGVSLTTGFNVDVARLLDRYAPTAGAYDGLFYSAAALNSPYASLSSGGAYVGVSVTLADSLHLSFGQASSAPGFNPYLLTPRLAVAGLGGAGLPYDARSTSSLLASLSWNFAKWGGIDFTASQATERGGALGESYAAVDAARTSALGLSAHVGFGGGWVTTASYSEGTTQLDLRPGAFAAGTESELHMQSYGIAVAKHGLFGKNDALGVAFSHPAPNYGAGTFSTGDSGDMQFFGRDKLFAGASPETDIELGYVTNFFGNSVALQANAAYQTNFGGQNGVNAVSLLSRAKIKF
ncbi:MAG: hypothetical protein ABSD21_00790 [Rhizomicrobium sp.]|jgi:hypothetical protein